MPTSGDTADPGNATEDVGDVTDAAEEYDSSDGGNLVRRMGAVVADESVNAIAILTIGYMAVSGVVAYEPIAAIASIALGAKYISSGKK